MTGRATTVTRGGVLLALLALLCISACGGSSNGIANTGGISGTGDISKPQVENIDIAHATYGTREKTTEFTLNSLAPVFVIKFTDSFDMDLTDFIEVSYARRGQTATAASIGNIVTRRSADGRTHYVMIMKSGRVEIAEQELSPGQEYVFVLKLKNNGTIIYLDKSSNSLQMSMSTKVMTFTYPIEISSNDSLVDLGLDPFNGINSTTPEFIVHSKYPIVNFDAADSGNGYGIIDHIDVQLNGRSIFKSGMNRIQVWNASAEAFKFLVLPQAGLSRGSTYVFSVAPASTLKMNANGQVQNVTSQDLPQVMSIITKP